MRFYWIFFGVLCLSFESISQVPLQKLSVTNNKKELYRVSQYIFFLEDENGDLSYIDASSDSLSSSYKPLEKPAIDFGLSESYYWLRLVVIYYVSKEWLSNFNYRIEVTPMYFVLSGALTLLILWLTISYHSVKAALRNPIETIRDE